jgi:hypothetical protein
MLVCFTFVSSLINFTTLDLFQATCSTIAQPYKDGPAYHITIDTLVEYFIVLALGAGNATMLSITTLCILTLRKLFKNVTFSLNDTQHIVSYVGCRIFYCYAVMLNVVVPSVVAPY